MTAKAAPDATAGQSAPGSTAAPAPASDRLVIFDTTLRDGEQCPGATMTHEEKLEVAELLDEMGLKPKIIAGTSIGALMGAAYALGLSGRAIRAMASRKSSSCGRNTSRK
mgnify:CR=1 FL=1